jgi:hypothetical protein
MAQEMRTMSHIIKQDLGLGAFKQQTGQCLTISLKENRKIKNQDACCHCTVKRFTRHPL